MSEGMPSPSAGLASGRYVPYTAREKNAHPRFYSSTCHRCFEERRLSSPMSQSVGALHRWYCHGSQSGLTQAFVAATSGRIRMHIRPLSRIRIQLPVLCSLTVQHMRDGRRGRAVACPEPLCQMECSIPAAHPSKRSAKDAFSHGPLAWLVSQGKMATDHASLCHAMQVILGWLGLRQRWMYRLLATLTVGSVTRYSMFVGVS
ncbi:uncharacterized protein BO80DRAFT_131757 [Aspergillus ibericus CBS 121593]|uniref:Uncharacterized protein n=1 Tax=Aspergillus ibericus CBS 121593 TaxID=1448316 RepID=A0A395HCP4_9EURO|nr:hypothetical protein BO80DRAFT_131757 [Aspergillus ibericus CBS 121593]RAL05249.1 hypothetical protein BO80DRAFT_131757 [Aspergillus ibericus CBS 121593]